MQKKEIVLLVDFLTGKKIDTMVESHPHFTSGGGTILLLFW